MSIKTLHNKYCKGIDRVPLFRIKTKTGFYVVDTWDYTLNRLGYLKELDKYFK